jgi:tRNA A-37 threonylcarbamoyl transferase component Bud32
MKTLDELLFNKMKLHDTVIQKKFKSKKHTVALITIDNIPRVIKWFQPGYKHNMNNEYQFLSRYSSDLNIPSVFNKDDTNQVLILQYISGENLCDLINSSLVSREEKTRLIIMLANWYADLHQTIKKEDTPQIHGDAHLRNFHFSDRIWGFDFEEASIGEPVQDIARLSASILMTNPTFTKEKLQLTQTFITSYQEASQNILENIEENISIALEEIKERRNNTYI